MKSNDNRDGSNKSVTPGATSQSRLQNGRESGFRTPLEPISVSERKNQAATVGKKKKKRPTAMSYGIRRNGSKSSSNLSKDKVAAVAPAASADGLKPDENCAPEPTAKVPVDPPGAVLGALPWMHHVDHSGGQRQMTSSEGGGGRFYPGGDYPTYQHPVFTPVNSWGYQPTHRQHQVPNGANHRSQQQWAVPNFLAPLANFMANHPNHGYHDGGIFPMANVHVERGGAPEPPSDAEDSEDAEATMSGVMSDDESMATATSGGDDLSARSNDVEVEEVKTKFIPSTFAPPEYVARIRARQEAAARAASAVQTRSMTARKNKAATRSGSANGNGGGGSGGGGAAVLSKTTVAAAHQACSPNGARAGKGGGSKAATGVMADGAKSPAPQVITVLGKRVTMVDPDHKVFVIDLLSPELCGTCFFGSLVIHLVFVVSTIVSFGACCVLRRSNTDDGRQPHPRDTQVRIERRDVEDPIHLHQDGPSRRGGQGHGAKVHW